ncbi:hypothetical protein BO79DRAFT_25673 [Aspergillus costaricaensis CBS 115574]|uniref:Uncharacterized protein n=1 Tax=Aspergillus costaricaensis CBS 115574 TaxID=1448317 RepID=A0ACD1IU33_9EURO|nr:hypothetical protein BO79DRAFT_25673 [Aspergillus costaricaensis CBS 115574]RAK93624.1 hypothetical protein BO79DRAFT_25673 [Aspergillus costaricaensis CBS 115574]
MGGREYQVSRIQQDSREKKERKKGKERKRRRRRRRRRMKKGRKKREEGKGQVTWMGQPRNGENKKKREGAVHFALTCYFGMCLCQLLLKLPDVYHTIVFLT